MAFRYNVAPVATKRTHVYRPNALSGDPKTASLGALTRGPETASPGALWAGKWSEVPETKMLDVLWEADFFSILKVSICIGGGAEGQQNDPCQAQALVAVLRRNCTQQLGPIGIAGMRPDEACSRLWFEPLASRPFFQSL